MNNKENEMMTALEVLKAKKEELENVLNPHLDLMERWNRIKADPIIWEKNTWMHPDYPYNKEVYIRGEGVRKTYDAICATIDYMENEINA